jgi:hypothetical protein
VIKKACEKEKQSNFLKMMVYENEYRIAARNWGRIKWRGLLTGILAVLIVSKFVSFLLI